MLFLGMTKRQVLESDCKNYLEGRLKSVQPLLDEDEKRLTTSSMLLRRKYLGNFEENNSNKRRL